MSPVSDDAGSEQPTPIGHVASSKDGDGSEYRLDMIDTELASDANLVVAIARWHQPALAEAYRRHGGAVHAPRRRGDHPRGIPRPLAAP